MIPGFQEESQVNIGERLRELRTERGLSIRKLAAYSQLNFNTLSLIENGRNSPSVSTLQQLAGALQVPITAFFENHQPKQRVVFQKAGQRAQAAFTHGWIEDLGRGLTLRGGQPLLLILRPGTNSGPGPIVHTGQELVYCLDGKLTYTIEGQDYLLEPGDSLIFEAHLPHSWSNPQAQEAARVLLIICPTDDNDRPHQRHSIPE